MCLPIWLSALLCQAWMNPTAAVSWKAHKKGHSSLALYSLYQLNIVIHNKVKYSWEMPSGMQQ